MKHQYLESLRRGTREYHRRHQWRLENGLFIPHLYPEENQEKLSWWDDVGFILGGRRVIVNWVHPRCAYEDAIEQQVLSEVASPEDWPPRGADGEKTYRKLGRSRKKVATIAFGPLSQPWEDYYSAFEARQDELMRSGIDLEIRPSMKIGWCYHAMLVSLTAPLEVRSTEGIESLAALARRLVKRETTIEQEWPEYRYGREDWLAEATKRV
ncbi:hypothetical protein G3N59_21335 [Paraburkholderia sp. Ac-20340]|uniref:hypothetical protein n=1 Tax=Paraburkholderia sp. Ac-20340 TaxID=2703888 RepID=UPI0019816A4B|nr:hypothetical protein [Paraburkholderia sp. Ac-20340]MBN3855927.1 hypothetical protein [Paraburkholderia sp. Ac-20340]